VGIIPPAMPIIGDKEVENEDFYMPSVLLWNPYLIYPQFVAPGSIKCTICGSPLLEGYWNDGSAASKQPRIIHGVDRIVLLVCAVYVCDNRHKIVSCDEIVLKMFPFKTIIPFYLLHRTGMTRDLLDTLVSLCKRGVNFYSMESYIMERRWKTYASQQDMHQLHNTLLSCNSLPVDFTDTELSKGPSNDILSKCFLGEFFEHEQLYLREMVSLPTTTSISFDHTFKVASNIGYFREDGKWINEYDALFVVLNENGHILTWQFTKGTSFAFIQQLLENLRSRPTGSQIKTVYIDDCCKLKTKIRKVFGSDVAVKLDLFHAIQRITRTLPKKHPLIKQCVKELRLVFRCDGDSGEKRLSSTPPPDIISNKMDAFLEKWINRTDEVGKLLLKSDSLSAIENLMRHVRCGCLSGIPPGAGTNRNERLHEHINAYFHRSRIGILLAYALLMVLFQAHNSAVRFRSKITARPISASPLRGVQQIDTISPFVAGIMPKCDHLQQADLWEIDLTDSTIDFGVIYPIYQISIEKLRVVKALAQLNLTELTDAVESFKKFEASSITDTSGFAGSKLQNILSMYSLAYSPTDRDGNCFFMAIAVNILADVKNWNACLTRVGVKVESTDSKDLAGKLRQVFVEEVTGNNRVRYLNYVVTEDIDFDYTTEARKFLQNGFYASQLGDLMPPAMATALGASLVVITTNQRNPVMYHNPLCGFAERAVFLIYHSSGPGHYDAAIPYSLFTGDCSASTCSVEPAVNVKCRCGVNSSSNEGKSCIQNPFYATRCKCYNYSKPCGSSCLCKGCANPFGTRPPKPELAPRKRRNHFNISIPSSKKFAMQRGESLSRSTWSKFETIVLTELTRVADFEGGNLTKLYNDTVSYAKSSFCAVPLEDDTVFREKTKAQIDSKLAFMKK
jgi:hypothetical protein